MPTRFNLRWFILHITFGIFLCLGSTLNAQEQERDSNPQAEANEHGDRLEILGFDPPLPAELRPGQRLTVRVGYEINSDEPALIFVRPMSEGKRSSGYAAHGSRRYEKGKGVVEGWFSFRQPTVIDQVQVRLITDRGANEPAVELVAKAEAKWAGEPVAGTTSEPPTELEKIRQRLGTVAELEPAEREKLLDEAFALLKKSEVGRPEFSLAIGVCRSLERVDNQLAARAYESFAEIIAATDDQSIARYAEKLKGASRRNRLPGRPIEMFGTTVEGEEFHWKVYKEKVVLIDFWATWCGPCIAELPNVKQQFERYKDQGFDVVGVSLDTDKSRLVKFLEEREIPWTNLFSEDAENTGWNHPLATHYGIMSIPATILVNQQGEVVSLSARGSELPRLLEELLGKPKE